MKKRVILYLFVSFLANLILLLSVYRVENISYYPSVYITNFLIVNYSICGLLIFDKYNFSLNKFFYLFVLFFLGIAPIIQFQENTVFWGGAMFTAKDYVLTNTVIIFILLIYSFLYQILKPIKAITSKKSLYNLTHFEKRNKNLNFILLSLISSILIIILYRFDFVSLLFRSDVDNLLVDNSSIQLIVRIFLRPIPILTLIIFKDLKISSKRTEYLLILLALLTNFPTSNARFYIAALYIPLIILYFNLVRRKYLLLLLLIGFSLFYLFPLLNQTRNLSSFFDFSFNLDLNTFNSGHYDSYQMFMRVLTMNIITYGKQLLAVLLFFIPRSIWSSKSVGSGKLLANELNFVFDNISMNFFGEGYINFGYLGIFLFVLLIVIYSKNFDYLYWNRFKNGSLLFNTWYLISLGLIIFLLRGDLLSSFSYSMGIFISLYFSIRLLGVRNRLSLKGGH